LTTLQSSLQALTGNTVTTDVTLTGSGEWIAGSYDETGASTYKATSSANRLDVALPAGTRSEIRSISGGVAVGTWIGTDGISHDISNQNLITDPGWFPAFTIASLLSSSNSVFTYVGQETRNGATVLHVMATQQFPTLAGNGGELLQHLTQEDIYLDPSTLLPVAYAFNAHPDTNAVLDIPVEIRYSNYQTVSGAQIPFHVQKYINNSLTLDLQIENAALNTGVTIAQ
jgi:hypothetical protein